MEGNEKIWDKTEIKVFRKFLGLSQGKFARKLYLDKMTVYHWERGSKKPAPNSIKRLNELYQKTKQESE